MMVTMKLDEVLETLETFYDYKTNWDGNGAEAPAVPVIVNSFSIYGLVKETDTLNRIFANESGHINFEWILPSSKVLLEVQSHKAKLTISFDGERETIRTTYAPIDHKVSFAAEDINLHI
jgi:hypothetical protein